MMVGLPIVGLATTEMVTAVENGKTGYVETDIDRLVERMRRLIEDRDHATELSANARAYASQRFNIRRFADDWHDAVTCFLRSS
jgi:glycosyltransferase involved in cell wall biosynthesis